MYLLTYYEICPINFEDVHKAVEFCNKLSEEEGLQKVYTINGKSISSDFNKNGYRLPTEAEWEYAARSRGRDDQKYSGTNTESKLGNYAWYGKSSLKTHPVGSKRPNELGLYNMSGNVWEWCWDCYGDYPSGPQTNPSGPSSGGGRVLRGGGSSFASHCCVAYRNSGSPSYGYDDLGFRLAMSSK